MKDFPYKVYLVALTSTLVSCNDNFRAAFLVASGMSKDAAKAKLGIEAHIYKDEELLGVCRHAGRYSRIIWQEPKAYRKRK